MPPGRSASVVGGQHHGGLAIGQAELLIQLRGQRHRARPDLRGGSATGIRGLAAMAALLRILLRGSPGVRRRLPFRGPQRFLQRPAQPLALLRQLFDFVFQAGYLFGAGFLRHVPAYSSAAGRQGQSGKRFHYAKQIRSCEEEVSDNGKESHPL